MALLTKEIFQLAEQRAFGQTYPLYVNNLREIGVESYTVNVSTSDRRIFTGVHDPVLELPGNETPLLCAETFDELALKNALHRTQTGQSNYPTFMQEIANAGVHFYTADLLNRVVTYFGKNAADKYAETVPNIVAK